MGTDADTPFGELLKHFRKRQRLTQKKLADLIGEHLNTVGAWERGVWLPASRGKVQELAKALRLTGQESDQLLSASLLPVPPRPPRRLPPRVRGFVGRERELQELCDRLRDGESVALAAAVAGMGGVGKSALAIEVVHHLAADPRAFSGGITWVRCDDRVALPGLIWVYDQLLADWHIALLPGAIKIARAIGMLSGIPRMRLRWCRRWAICPWQSNSLLRVLP